MEGEEYLKGELGYKWKYCSFEWTLSQRPFASIPCKHIAICFLCWTVTMKTHLYYKTTALCKSVEPPLISLYFPGCSVLLKYLQEYREVKFMCQNRDWTVLISLKVNVWFDHLFILQHNLTSLRQASLSFL